MGMASLTRYMHTSIVARDVKRLADFYEQTLGCVRVRPSQELSGDDMGRAVGLPFVRQRGEWLRLPGVEGCILEIFEYAESEDRPTPSANRVGLNHTAFEVADVDATVEAIVEGGGEGLGEIIDLEFPDGGRLTYVFVRDPEGNLIELMQAPLDDADEPTTSSG